MDWREVAVTVSSEGEEAVADLFYQLGCSGVSVEDPALLAKYIESGEWDYHSFEKAEVTGLTVVKGYFAENDELREKLRALDWSLEALRKGFPAWHVLAEGTTVKEEDWESAWKAYFKPFRLGRRFFIKPTWEQADILDEDLVLELDPGMAFGTGTHPTTALSLRALEEVVKPGHKVFDLGTGSGILAIAAAKLGAEVEAVDLDPVAVQVAEDNVRLNNVADRVRVVRGDLGAALTGQGDVVIANIIADVIIVLLADIKGLLSPEGDFLACGIIDRRAEDVAESMEKAGLEVVERREEAGWVLLRGRWAKNEPV